MNKIKEFALCAIIPRMLKQGVRTTWCECRTQIISKAMTQSTWENSTKKIKKQVISHPIQSN